MNAPPSGVVAGLGLGDRGAYRAPGVERLAHCQIGRVRSQGVLSEAEELMEVRLLGGYRAFEGDGGQTAGLSLPHAGLGRASLGPDAFADVVNNSRALQRDNFICRQSNAAS